MSLKIKFINNRLKRAVLNQFSESELDTLKRKFDVDYYLTKYADVKHRGIEPLYHYLLSGEKENRSPMPDFSPGDFKKSYLYDVEVKSIFLIFTKLLNDKNLVNNICQEHESSDEDFHKIFKTVSYEKKSRELIGVMRPQKARNMVVRPESIGKGKVELSWLR